MKLSTETSTCLDHREVDRLKRLKSESLPLEMLGAIERRQFCRVTILGESLFADRITGTLYRLDGSPVSGTARSRIVFGAKPTAKIPRDVEDANSLAAFTINRDATQKRRGRPRRAA
ncbi:hypothetical protein [Methylocaldum gracile]|jgi:hypothetical protein|uniref:hypothetical protein n=1 Tax=Methylocaldum sp. 0917 TaxID=2485163 RepID=UPI0010602597